MKSVLLFCLIVLASTLNAQVKDTIYKKVLRTGEVYSFVYIDRDKNSSFLKKLETRGAIDKRLEDYTDSLKTKYKDDFERDIQIKGLPEKWISLEQYKGKYYTYFPCDFCSRNLLMEFSSNLMYSFSCENEVLLLSSFKRTNSWTYRINTKRYYDPDKQFKIYIIDKEKGIAVFELENNKERSYSLMVDATKIRQFPVMVHICPTDKDLEFMGFDEIDYKTLIKNSK